MIITLTGAYRNAGDHLIGVRARALLKEHIGGEVVNVDRRRITNEHYELFNRARAILLCGGPAYQVAIYPQIYPLDLSRINAPIVPYGLGWKAKVDQSPAQFRFNPEAEQFIRAIHRNIKMSSARDPLTMEVVKQLGVDNVAMTGCPAWYDLRTMEASYRFHEEVRVIVFSTPIVIDHRAGRVLRWLTRRFPNARKIATFHDGLVFPGTAKGWRRSWNYTRFAALARLQGWSVASFPADSDKMGELYRSADLNVGYRVHAHIFCLSQRISSILINEDIRGVGQAMALGGPNITITGNDISSLQAAVEDHFSTRGRKVAESIEVMRQTYPEMRRFLATL